MTETLKQIEHENLAAEKIDFIHNVAGISYDDLAEILPTQNNGEINQVTLNLNFNLVDFLKGELFEGVLPRVFKEPASRYGGKTLVDLMKEEKTEELLNHYRRVLSFASTG